MANNKADSWSESVDKKMQLKEDISAIKGKLSAPRLFNFSSKKYAVSDAMRRLESFIYREGKGSEAGVPEKKRNELDNLKEAVAQSKREYQALSEEKQLLETSLAELETELLQFELSAGIEDIVHHQKKINSLQNTISSFEKSIAEQQKVMAANLTSKPIDLYRKREDILADKAIGVDVGDKLQAIELKISETENERQKAVSLHAEAENAIRGLCRKIDETKSLIGRLERDKKEMIIAFLKSEIRHKEDEYRLQAGELVYTYGRLYAMDDMLTRISGETGVSVFSIDAGKIKIPHVAPLSKLNGFLFDAGPFCGHSGWIAEEKARLADKGIIF